MSSASASVSETQTVSVRLEPLRRSLLPSVSGQLAQQDGRQAGQRHVTLILFSGATLSRAGDV